jgi:hypothetical protein
MARGQGHERGICPGEEVGLPVLEDILLDRLITD